MSAQPRIQLGGTLDPQRHVYVERPEDKRVLALLSQGEYVNIVSSRQMGKSSLMARAVQELRSQGTAAVTIDLAAELGTTLGSVDTYYIGLIHRVTRELRAALSPTPAGGIEPGGHDAGYWRSQAAAQLRFAATHLAGR